MSASMVPPGSWSRLQCATYVLTREGTFLMVVSRWSWGADSVLDSVAVGCSGIRFFVGPTGVELVALALVACSVVGCVEMCCPSLGCPGPVEVVLALPVSVVVD